MTVVRPFFRYLLWRGTCSEAARRRIEPARGPRWMRRLTTLWAFQQI